MGRLASVPERRGSFVEVRHFGALEGALESRGTLRLSRGTLEKDTTWPVPERLQIDGQRLVVTAGNDPPQVVDAGMAPELRVLIDAVRGPLVGDTAALRRGFTATVGGTMAGWTLDLVPREPAGVKLLRRVVLEGREAEVDRLTVVQANGDDQVMVIMGR